MPSSTNTSIENLIQYLISIMATIAAIFGAIFTWWGVVHDSSVTIVSMWIAQAQWGLIVILPLSLGLGSWLGLRLGYAAVYRNREDARIIGATTGIIGGLAGNLFFVLISLYIPTVVTDLKFIDLRAEFLGHLSPWAIVTSVAITAILGIILSQRIHHQIVTGSQSDNSAQ